MWKIVKQKLIIPITTNFNFWKIKRQPRNWKINFKNHKFTGNWNKNKKNLNYNNKYNNKYKFRILQTKIKHNVFGVKNTLKE